MKYPIEIRNANTSLEYYHEVSKLLIESENYLQGHHWCTKIHKRWLFINLGKVLCIFLYEIENDQSPEDNLLWVVTGDLPPMYLDTINATTTHEVVSGYVNLVQDWIEHAEKDLPMDDCYPLESGTSTESIGMLKKRIDMLKTVIEPEIEDIPFTAAAKESNY